MCMYVNVYDYVGACALMYVFKSALPNDSCYPSGALPVLGSCNSTHVSKACLRCVSRRFIPYCSSDVWSGASPKTDQSKLSLASFNFVFTQSVRTVCCCFKIVGSCLFLSHKILGSLLCRVFRQLRFHGLPDHPGGGEGPSVQRPGQRQGSPASRQQVCVFSCVCACVNLPTVTPHDLF